jgi:methanethiol S-methyltransferase
MNYFLLILFWVIYYAVHSILASTAVKDFFRKTIGKYFRYYRLGYSVFATITLIFLLFFQYSFYSPHLINSVFLKYFSTLFLVLPGLVIMFISIKKYFMLLSGVRSIFIATPPSELKVSGIHRFVRHPLYLGTILFVCGLFFLFPTISNLIAVLLLIGYVLTGIIFEEKKLIKEFGKNYEEYISEVPMLIPIFKNKKTRK